MKDGDTSLILKNVTNNDIGTYQSRSDWMKQSCKLISIIYLTVDPPDQKNITAESGQDVTLPCRAPNNNIRAVEWSRADLKEEQHVLLYRDDQFVHEGQHPSFKNRVDLQDRQMKDGDVSLILKDVTIADSGTYKCHVFMSGTNNEPISITLIVVDPPGQPGGHTEDGGKKDGSVGLKVGLPVAVFLLFVVVVVVFLIYRKHQKGVL
ncbi:CD226 antigen-like isoform X7 [Simochromis diagramma]|uniref:CD226 antigen-like isoform X7 n=1 Tax=Simochromis diagramma TaxID=43689 RepID=UPI001A7F060A|nr:CD226 antigen-like isoform X7 [Simochromis diagramma]